MANQKEIRRVALVQPFQVTSEGYEKEIVKRRGQTTEVPLGLAYISAFLKMHGYEVKIFDANMMAVKGITLGRFLRLEEAEDELFASIEEFNPDVLGVSCLFHYIYRTAHRIVGRAKSKNRKIITVMGGAYPTVSTEIALRDENVDFVILGEGERPFLNLLEALNGRFNFNELRAVAYRASGGWPVIKRGHVLLDSLDDIPLPDRSDFALEDYYKYGRHLMHKFEIYEGGEFRIATLTATRGCVFDCSFCIDRILWQRGLRTRSPESILNEMEFLKAEYGINCFAFNDDNLLIKKSFASQLLQGMIDRRLNIRWTTGGMSVSGLDENLIKLAVLSGCLIFNIAIESASPETLAKIRKPVKLDEALRVANRIKKQGAYLMGLFMLGFPEETEEQFFETIRFGKSLECDWTLYSCLTPFPGSDVYDEVSRNGMLPLDVQADFERLHFRDYVLHPRYLSNEFVSREAYFANLEQNFFENPNLKNPARIGLAFSDFQNVVRLSPTHASAHYCLGRIYEERDEIDLAKQFYRAARENLTGLHEMYFKRAGVVIPRID